MIDSENYGLIRKLTQQSLDETNALPDDFLIQEQGHAAPELRADEKHSRTLELAGNFQLQGREVTVWYKAAIPFALRQTSSM